MKNKKRLLIPLTLITITGTAFALAVVNGHAVPFQSEGYGTLDLLRSHKFSNEYNPTLTEILSGPDYEKIMAEAKSSGCRGGDSVSINAVEPRKVLNCFQINNGTDLLTEKVYNLVKRGITSITFKEAHLCMATYKGEGKWLTSAHCFADQRTPYKDYKLLLDKPYPIKVRLCMLDNCDLALVEPVGGPNVTSGLEPTYEDLTKVYYSTTLFVPGIEERTLIPGNNQSGVDKVIMWSKIKSGCIPYEVKIGCVYYLCSTLEGFSGAPVFSVDGSNARLIGVHAGGQPGKQCGNKNINSAVTADKIASFVR